MKNMNTNPYSTHQDIALLLPWYVNKTLHGPELDSVEIHLKVCLTCRRELATLQNLSLAVNQEGAFDSAALASFSHLKNRIHKAASSVDPIPEVNANPARKRHQNFELNFPKLDRPKLAMAAVIVLALLIPGYLNTGKPVSNDYRTLSDSEVSKARKNEIRLVFSKNTRQQQIDTILKEIHGQIVAGPSEQSVYTIRINKIATKQTMLKVIEQLRNNSNIVFAEPAYALLSSDQDGSDTQL